MFARRVYSKHDTEENDSLHIHAYLPVVPHMTRINYADRTMQTLVLARVVPSSVSGDCGGHLQRE